MRYRIEYADGKCCNFANSRKDLIGWLNLLKDETITDIRKLYKSGVSDSVMDIYKKYLPQERRKTHGMRTYQPNDSSNDGLLFKS